MLAGHVIVCIEWCPFAAIWSVLTQRREEMEGAHGSEGREEIHMHYHDCALGRHTHRQCVMSLSTLDDMMLLILDTAKNSFS